MKAGFIGAGKVGFSLGKLFACGGIQVTGYYSRHPESAREAAAFTGTKSYDTLKEIVQDSDALFLTVPDGRISSVFQQIQELGISGKQICHCSGAMTAEEAFPDIQQSGAFGYSIHPLFPVSSKYDAYRELADAFFCIEGSGPHLAEWQARLAALGPTVQLLRAENKARYHAACAIASNLMCALVQESIELLTDCGFTAENALKALAPLMRSNLEHVIQDGPMQALTGPVERGDAETVEKHLQSLPAAETRETYRLLSRKLVSLAGQRHPERDYDQLKELLKQGEYHDA